MPLANGALGFLARGSNACSDTSAAFGTTEVESSMVPFTLRSSSSPAMTTRPATSHLTLPETSLIIGAWAFSIVLSANNLGETSFFLTVEQKSLKPNFSHFCQILQTKRLRTLSQAHSATGHRTIRGFQDIVWITCVGEVVE